MHDDLGRKNQTTLYILPRHWLYEWFSQFHTCGTCSVLSRSPSIEYMVAKLDALHMTTVRNPSVTSSASEVTTIWRYINLSYYPPPLIGGTLSDAFVWRLSVWLLSVSYIGRNLRTKRPRKTKIGIEVAHVTRDLDTTFKVKRSRSPGCFGWLYWQANMDIQ